MKSVAEIVQRLKIPSETDLLGLAKGDWYEFLTPGEAAEYGVLPTGGHSWDYLPRTVNNVLAVMRDYMSFALDKAADHRGISASRSIEHFRNWLWLIEDEDPKYSAALSFLSDNRNYPQYGVPILKKICEAIGYHFPTGNSALDHMSRGEPCGCSWECGCEK